MTTATPDPRGDLVGQRFGELTVERFHDLHGEHPARRWWCRCDCGKPAIRTTAQLFRALRDRRTPCCRTCGIEVRYGKRTADRGEMREVYRDLWDRRGTLWSATAEQRLAQRVREDLIEAFGPPVDRVHPSEVLDAWEPPPGPVEPRKTWEDIGRAIGVSREQARMIAERALRKIREALKVGRLAFDLDDDATEARLEHRRAAVDAAIETVRRNAEEEARERDEDLERARRRARALRDPEDDDRPANLLALVRAVPFQVLR